jgi:hypothetical protein
MIERSPHTVCDLDDAPLFVARQRGVFTSMAVDQHTDNPVDRRHILEMARERSFVQMAAVCIERTQRGGINTIEGGVVRGNHWVCSR